MGSQGFICRGYNFVARNTTKYPDSVAVQLYTQKTLQNDSCCHSFMIYIGLPLFPGAVFCGKKKKVISGIILNKRFISPLWHT
jgi:hypothetical protein